MSVSTVEGLISNAINFSPTKTYGCQQIGGGKLSIQFRLSVPAWFDDALWVINKHQTVRYSRSKKIGSGWMVDIQNISKGYPRLSKSKHLCYTRVYDVLDFCKPSFDIFSFLYKEKELIFREVKSNITLEKIGKLSKQYQAETDGVWFDKTELDYASTRFSHEVNKEYNDNKVSLKEGFEAF